MKRAIPALWLIAFFAVPFLAVMKLSFSTLATAIPPYMPVFDFDFSTWITKIQSFTFDNYALIFSDDLYIKALYGSVKTAFISTALIALIGYAIAFAITKSRAQNLLLTLIIIPFWTSFLIRVYAWIGILKPDGYLAQAFLWLGLTPPELLNTEYAVIIGIVYSYLPFMILPLYAGLKAQDKTLMDAAFDLGCTKFQAFLRVTLPLSMPSLMAGCIICFIPIMGEIMIPDMLGGRTSLMLGKVIWVEFFNNRDWPVASALSVLLLALILTPFILWRRKI
jgi:putrescine transport system permease protein